MLRGRIPAGAAGVSAKRTLEVVVAGRPICVICGQPIDADGHTCPYPRPDAGAGPLTDELTLTGQITTASNATFLGRIGDAAFVYKPIAGEKPLWDFPDCCLAHREVAAYPEQDAADLVGVDEPHFRSRASRRTS